MSVVHQHTVGPALAEIDDYDVKEDSASPIPADTPYLAEI